jgi:fibronectin-binding autotransporter adhesin
MRLIAKPAEGATIPKRFAARLLPGLLAVFLATDARAQLVADGTTRILDGVITNLAGNLTVGTNAPFTRLHLINGGRVTNASSYIGYNAASSSNSVVVEGVGSWWSHGTLRVGEWGSHNNLIITNGGTVIDSSCTFGYFASSSNNSAVVTGTNSFWRITGAVGSAKGERNLIVVTNGGKISSGSAALRISDTAVITSPASAWSNSSIDLRKSNLLVISNEGAMFTTGTGTLGASSGYDSNSVVVSDPGSLWRLSSQLGVGNASSGNRLCVTNGGILASVYAWIGYSSSAAMGNLVEISGTDSLWTNSGSLTIGSGASGNRLTIRNGGKVVSGSCTIGSGASANQLTVTDPESVLQVRGDLRTGDPSSGGNFLVVSNGASVFANRVLIGGSSLSGASSITVNSGRLVVTNAISTTYGALLINSGLVEADSLSVTGSLSSRLIFNSGTLRTRALMSTVATRYTLGDGVSPAVLEMLGGGAGPFGVAGLVLTNNATLKGSGTITGNVFLAVGGTISPGSSIGDISVNGSLTLSNGSTTVMELDAISGGADRIVVSTNLTYGGTLQLANLVGSFSIRQAFALFSAVNYYGAFTNIVPNAPGLGLRWNTNGLTIDGTLRIAAIPTEPPVIAAAVLEGSNLVLSASGGNAFEPCFLVTATNVALPLSNWFRIRTNFFDSDGRVNFTNSVAAGEAQRFFRLQVE